MKITYDPELDVLRLLFSNAPIEESDEDKPDMILDYDKDSNIVGLEILDAALVLMPEPVKVAALNVYRDVERRLIT